VPSGSMPALLAAVPLTCNNAVAPHSSTMRRGEAVVSDTRIRGAVTCAILITIEQNTPTREGWERIRGP
jgi:hypothetical protein